MDEDGLSEKVRQELQDIARRKGHLLEASRSGDRTSLKIINEFLKCNRDQLSINKQLMSALLLISNHLVNESIKQIFRKLEYKTEEKMVLQLYLYLQMSSNFLDGFLLGHAFIKVLEDKNILQSKNMDILEIFKQIYLIRMRHGESAIVHIIDEETGLVSHFEKAYRELFTSKSVLLRDLARDNIDTVVHYLMLTFFDGILTARIIARNPSQEDQ